MIRVGIIDSFYNNFTPIVVLPRDRKWRQIGPYELKDDKGRIIENIWQSLKVYENVPAVRIPLYKYIRDDKLIWTWPEEKHYDDGKILPAWFKWHEAIKNNNIPVRYPVGYHHRHKCMFAFDLKQIEEKKENLDRLDYITSRKKTYVPFYINAVKKHYLFEELKRRTQNGENLLIIEVDGPHKEGLKYYQDAYNTAENFIENDTMLCNEENLRIMLNDSKYPFGHGYCLAMALLNLENLTNE